MRWMVTTLGIGALAVGVVLGLVMSGMSPSVEAAPKNQQGQTGRLIDLGVQMLAGNELRTLGPVDIGDCSQVMGMAANVAGEVQLDARTSPDGVAELPINTIGVQSWYSRTVNIPAGHVFALDATAPFLFVKLVNATGGSGIAETHVTLWCEPF